MRNTIMLDGLKKKDTYDSLVEYLDGGQERVKYPDRLATQLRNSQEISNLLDNEGLSWLEGATVQLNQLQSQILSNLLFREHLEPQQGLKEQQVVQRVRKTTTATSPVRRALEFNIASDDAVERQLTDKESDEEEWQGVQSNKE
jgi:hypothetical protein